MKTIKITDSTHRTLWALAEPSDLGMAEMVAGLALKELDAREAVRDLNRELLRP